MLVRRIQLSVARDIIGRAHRLLGIVQSGDALPEADYQDGLVALNAMISSWQTEKLIVYALVDTAFTLVNGTSSYTVGPAGNFALTPRPQKIENVFVRNASIDYPVELVESDKWFSIPDKASQTDLPIYAYYEPTLTTGTLLLWPVPNAAYSLHLVTWITISSLAALSTAIALPQGYERALAYNLAVEIAPEVSRTVIVSPITSSTRIDREATETVKKIAIESKAAIKRANQRPMIADSDLYALVRGQKSNVYSGGYVA